MNSVKPYAVFTLSHVLLSLGAGYFKKEKCDATTSLYLKPQELHS